MPFKTTNPALLYIDVLNKWYVDQRSAIDNAIRRERKIHRMREIENKYLRAKVHYSGLLSQPQEEWRKLIRKMLHRYESLRPYCGTPPPIPSKVQLFLDGKSLFYEIPW
jgi:hypothetical protein